MSKEIVRHRETEFGTGIDNSSVGDSDSNGTIERAIQDVEGQTRTLRAALEERVQERGDLDNPVVPWMVTRAVPDHSMQDTTEWTHVVPGYEGPTIQHQDGRVR